jgi:hypothetical protein
MEEITEELTSGGVTAEIIKNAGRLVDDGLVERLKGLGSFNILTLKREVSIYTRKKYGWDYIEGIRTELLRRGFEYRGDNIIYVRK